MNVVQLVNLIFFPDTRQTDKKLELHQLSQSVEEFLTPKLIIKYYQVFRDTRQTDKKLELDQFSQSVESF